MPREPKGLSIYCVCFMVLSITGYSLEAHGQTRMRNLVLKESAVAIRTIDSQNKRMMGDTLRTDGFGIRSSRSFGPKNYEMINLENPAMEREIIHGLVEDLARNREVGFSTPVWEDSAGLLSFPTPYIHVKFQKGIERKNIVTAVESVPGLAVLEEDFAGMPAVWRLESSVHTGMEVLEQVKALEEIPIVVWAEPDMVGQLVTNAIGANDPFFECQWGLRNDGLPFSVTCEIPGDPVADVDMQVDQAWEYTLGDPSVIVVVLDNGVQQNHPDINQIPGKDFTDQPGVNGGPVNECEGHGTQMAGIISARMNNSRGIAGVAPNSRIASARFNGGCGANAYYMESWLINALQWAEEIGAKVTSSSFSLGEHSSALFEKYAQTNANGIIHFASSGNKTFFADQLEFPASHPNVLAVNAENNTGSVSPLTNYGPGMFCTTPGWFIWTTDRTDNDNYHVGDYIPIHKTSPACAMAAGAAALVLSYKPWLPPSEIKSILASTASDWDGSGYNDVHGWGMLNTYAAIAQISQTNYTFVDWSAGFGGDGSESAPFATVSLGVAQAPANGVVVVSTGSYNEPIIIDKPIRIINKGGSVRIGE